jgi:putative DNA primase/helicase
MPTTKPTEDIIATNRRSNNKVLSPEEGMAGAFRIALRPDNDAARLIFDEREVSDFTGPYRHIAHVIDDRLRANRPIDIASVAKDLTAKGEHSAATVGRQLSKPSTNNTDIGAYIRAIPQNGKASDTKGFSGSSGSPTHTNGKKYETRDGALIANNEAELQKFLIEHFAAAPQTLETNLAPVAIMEPEMIPEPLRNWLLDVSDLMSAPLDFAAAAAIVALATVVGRSIALRPKQFDDGWNVTPNLWGYNIGKPGDKKSPATDEVFKPLKRLAAEKREKFEGEMKRWEAEQIVAEAKAKAATATLQKAIKTGAGDEELLELAQRSQLQQGQSPPVCRRYIANDTTMEAFGIVLMENPRGVLLNRDELMGFLKSFEKQGHETDRAFYLEGWNGTGDFMFDRVIRGIGQYLPALCISVFGTIQPAMLSRYVRTATTDDADGLIQRFQIGVYPDPVPFRLADRHRNTEAKNRAFEIFKKLDELDPKSVDVDAQTDDYSSIPYLRFSPEAQQLWNDWWTDLETNKLQAGEMPIIESHLAKYRSLMPSLALLFHLVNVVDGKSSGPVDVRASGMAAAWCDYLESHARRIYQMAFDGDTEPARRLAERIKESLQDGFKPHEVVRKGWRGLDTADEVSRALGFLEERGWVTVVRVSAGSEGGRPSEQVYVNPKVREVSE